MMKKWKAPLVLLLVYGVLALTNPEAAAASGKVAQSYTREMMLIMPAVLLLMGLIEVWVPKEKIQQLLGKESGLKGMALSFALGTLPTGPLYVAFPMTVSLLRKGARISNIIIFMGAWAALKIPQLLIEVEFMGFPFALLRFVLTLAAIIISGFVIEKLMKDVVDQPWQLEE